MSDDDLADFVRSRTARQNTALDSSRTVTIFMHENALRLPVGNPAVMAEQRHYLLQLAVRKYLSLRVVPAVAGAHPALSGNFDLLKFKRIPPLVYLESEGANVFLEDQPSVGLYENVLKSLERTALDEEQTKRLIIDIIDEEARGGLAQE